jgi:hypothetical protein
LALSIPGNPGIVGTVKRLKFVVVWTFAIDSGVFIGKKETGAALSHPGSLLAV